MNNKQDIKNTEAAKTEESSNFSGGSTTCTTQRYAAQSNFDLQAHNLTRVLNPRSIALIGATPRADSFAALTAENLSGFTGSLFLVNPRYEEINGTPCYASIKDIEAEIDSAIIALPGQLVEEVLIECSQAQVGGAVVYASGFAEMGDAHNRQRQERITQLAKESGLRILGPNCMGVVNYGTGAIQSFQQFPHKFHDNGRSVGLVCQSGALSLALSQAVERGYSFSHILTFGNGADVDLSDLVTYLAHDPNCKAIACVFEGIAHPHKLLQAAAIARKAQKPLIIFKLAISESGAQAALSHTGSLAGSEELYRAFLEKEQVIWVDRFDAVLETAAFFAKAPACRAKGIGIVAASGGAGIMAVDAAEKFQLPLPQPEQKTQQILQQNIPAFGSANNPCDVTAEVVKQPETLLACLSAMANDPSYGALIVAHTVAGQAFNHRAHIYSQVAKEADKPVCAVWLSEWRDGPGAVLFENNPYISVFSSMENCLQALERWQWYEEQQQLAQSDEKNKKTDTLWAALPLAEKTQAEIRQILTKAQGSALAEDEAKALIRAYGVQTPAERRVFTLAEAQKAATEVGYPIALKVLSQQALHKTELGGVEINIQNAEQLKTAWHRMNHSLQEKSPDLSISGYSVQAMAQPGVEILIGAKNDPHFGPVLIIGFGGVLVEVIKDTVLSPVPVSPERARYLLGSLKNQTLLSGFRGSPAVDLDALAQTISNLSNFVYQYGEYFLEMDINPLICRGKQIIAVDALIVC